MNYFLQSFGLTAPPMPVQLGSVLPTAWLLLNQVWMTVLEDNAGRCVPVFPKSERDHLFPLAPYWAVRMPSSKASYLLQKKAVFYPLHLLILRCLLQYSSLFWLKRFPWMTVSSGQIISLSDFCPLTLFLMKVIFGCKKRGFLRPHGGQRSTQDPLVSLWFLL